LISFYHGQQRVTNFGAVGNADTPADNFDWYTESPLFDGGFIVATDEDHMALDVYDCEHYGWAPGIQQHLSIDTSDPRYNMAAGYFCCDSAVVGLPGVPGECDSVFFIGIKDSCIDFSVKIKVYSNTGPDSIKNMYAGVFEDWDVGTGNNLGNMDTLHNIIWQYDPTADTLVFGVFKAPFYDEFMQSMVLVYNPEEVYPTGSSSFNCGNLPGLPYLYQLMSNTTVPPQPRYRYVGYWLEGSSDHSILMTAPPFSLGVGDKHIEIWINFGRNLNDGLSWEQWYHRVLRYVGFYRGDVNASDSLEVPAMDATDLVYLIQYLFQNGPAPKPYLDQGDIDGSCCLGYFDPKQGGAGCVNVLDVVYLINYVFIDGPPPVDYVRFIPQCWHRTSLFENPNWR
jgi:hypothetical protein